KRPPTEAAYGCCRSCSSLRADENIEHLVSLLRRLSFLECVCETEDRIRQKEFIRDRKQGAKFGEPVRVGGRVELAQGVAIAECVHLGRSLQAGRAKPLVDVQGGL